MLRLTRRAFSSTPSPRVAVVGSGPGGFYTAKYLLRDSKNVHVTILDRWPTPFGLVRYGVAPDHPEVKSVQDDFEEVATSERFSYAGHVFVGHPADAPSHTGPVVPLNDLMNLYDAVVVATGCDLARKLDLPGAELEGVVNARAFVGWYNAEPTFSHLQLPDVSDQLRSVIIGHGNVALDCARLLAAPSSHLDATDIHSTAFEALQRLPSKRLIHVVGRRGATQAAFTTKEVRELTELENAALVIDPAELEAGDTEASIEEGKARPLKRKRKFLDQASRRPGGDLRPGRQSRRARLRRSGWVKRGPTGIVGSNVADARETAAAVLEDLAASGVAGYGEGTSWADWRRIDGVEKANARNGAPRAKFSDVEGMLDAAKSS
ncbi:unnamed protein product [Pelagomonas calceolata]|uniref:adrenodoxin-NADP(+) reductase n=1 Tax=Pelagomonas calceolata TaxID=35677 RepID=A0A8J2WQV9_9STRA|nr:unnamed protein product [Pelagomonas calceolata]